MKSFKLAAFATAALSLALPLQAQTVDPLWTKTLAHSALVKKWAPQEKTTRIDASGDDKNERVKVRARLKGWDNGKPVYDTVQIEPKPEPGKSAKGQTEMNDANNMTDELMRMNAPVRRTDGQVLHGKSWTMFDVAESKGPVNVSVRLWVDPVTGVAHHVESKLRGTLMFDMFMATSYVPHKVAGSVPERSDFRLKVLVPFVDARVNILSSMDNWVPRPN
ncbi:hypothetical protein CR105_14840 [Massilia eurypsychrophila]|jgi:hypothetical protein|uniref:Uncharacterized protein n=1 Tax=Massilia eurypsychrophila TaxID=1485217 RepID=A0A2G8TE57_9BURK|nr:hypothetical protein [Massilia eurypsychrophila]PIL44341.1 hypothetical protein CR105_14840 [Massilia eurypsychrophila]